jgi:hypothetical protein
MLSEQPAGRSDGCPRVLNIRFFEAFDDIGKTIDAKGGQHGTLPDCAGGSAIGLSATDAYGTEPLPVMHHNEEDGILFRASYDIAA